MRLGSFAVKETLGNGKSRRTRRDREGVRASGSKAWREKKPGPLLALVSKPFGSMARQ